MRAYAAKPRRRAQTKRLVLQGIHCEELLPGLWRFEDTCNVYVLRIGEEAIAIDFGSGAWMDRLPALGIRNLSQVFLTHHHADQCQGLSRFSDREFEVHAPAGEEVFLDPGRASDFHCAPWFGTGCPASYAAPHERIPGLLYDLMPFGWSFIRGFRLRFIPTPGHGPNALSVVLEHEGRQIVCCGDAAHAGATIWEPYHLEWDHWTGSGALAAWQGVTALQGLRMDLLCPSHGPVIANRPRQMLNQLAGKLLRFHKAKGQISPGEADRNLPAEPLGPKRFRYLPHLFQFGMNGYLLVSRNNEGMVIDPWREDLELLDQLCEQLGVRPTATAATHYHFDHCDGLPDVCKRYGATAWLHPQVVQPLENASRTILPWLLPRDLRPYSLWPASGTWAWNEYRFQIAPYPGQTWWHCAFMTCVDDRQVLFGGDSFHPSTQWNGTGGFCAYNNSRFLDGFVPSAERALDWKPDLVAAGHTNCYAFSAGKYRKIIRWARHAHEAVQALCPSGDLERDYYSVFQRIHEEGYSTEGFWPGA